MYVNTDKPFLYYRHAGQTYKVPSHGRIMKMIDFGRAIYKYKGRRICSDSFHPKGDAATQYNCEPYFNKNKPDGTMRKLTDVSKLNKIGWSHNIDIKEGIRLVYNWYKSHN